MVDYVCGDSSVSLVVVIFFEGAHKSSLCECIYRGEVYACISVADSKKKDDN